MKNLLKYFKISRIITYIVVLWILYSIYSYYFISSTKTITTIKEYKVTSWNIENSIKVTWKASLVDEQTLKFNQVGTVAKVYYKDGAKVKKWALIAELEKDDVNNTIKQAELSLNDAQIKLQDLLNWSEYKDILNAKNSVITAKNKILTLENDLANLIADKENKLKDYDNQIIQKNLAIKNNESDIKSKELQLTNLKNELDTLEITEAKWLTDYDVDLTKTISDAYINAKKQIIDIENSLFDSDEILGITDTNRYKNDSYETYLWAKNTQTKNNADNNWNNSNLLFIEAKNLYNNLNTTNQKSEEILSFLNKLLDSYDKLIDLGKSWQEMMNSSISSSSFTQNDIDNKSSTFSSITSNAQSTYSSIKTTIANIEKLSDPEIKKAQSTNTINSKKQSISDTEIALDKLKNTTTTQLQNDLEKLISDREYSAKNYEAQIKQKNLDIESAKNSLEYSQESLKIVEDWATTVELSQAKNSVAKQKLSLENSRKSLDKYELTAPFDGTIRKIDFKVWDNITADEQKYIYIENPNLVEISVTLDQLDIVKVSLWQEAKIIFDSYPDKEFIWKVSEKDSTPIATSWVTSYTVTITLDKWDTQIFSSMTAKVYILTKSKKDVIIIPSSYIETASWITYVVTKSDSKEIKKEVATWLTDDTNTEITDWLELGEIIIKKITSTATTTSWLINPWNRRNSSSSSSSNISSSSRSSWWSSEWWPPPWM